MASMTLAQKSNGEGFPKSSEVIEITGCHGLEASDRAILNLLYQHAHDSGRLSETGAEWSLPLSTLRFSAAHKGSERVRDSMRRLMRVVVIIPYQERGEERISETHRGRIRAEIVI